MRSIPLLTEDRQWLRDLLKDGEPQIVRALVEQYRERWRAASGAEAVEHKRDNAGRRAGNTWIREEIEKMKHAEPQAVMTYRRMLKDPYPRCCHTCDHYQDSGECRRYHSAPPADFAATIPTLCEGWEEELPF